MTPTHVYTRFKMVAGDQSYATVLQDLTNRSGGMERLLTPGWISIVIVYRTNLPPPITHVKRGVSNYCNEVIKSYRTSSKSMVCFDSASKDGRSEKGSDSEMSGGHFRSKQPSELLNCHTPP